MHPFSLSAVISFMIAKLSRSKKQQQKTKSKPRKLCGKRSVPRLGGSDEPLGNLSVTPLYASELVFNARPPIKAFNLSGLFTCICFPSVCVCLLARPSRNRLIDLKCMLPPLACSALPPFPPPPPVCYLHTYIKVEKCRAIVFSYPAWCLSGVKCEVKLRADMKRHFMLSYACDMLW